jgi:hypothetical protein
VEKEREGKTAAVRRRNLDGELFISINVSLAASMNFYSTICLHSCPSSIFGRHHVGEENMTVSGRDEGG